MTLCMLGKKFYRHTLKYFFFFFFSENFRRQFDEMWVYFLEKNKKNIINLSSAESTQRVVKVKNLVVAFFFFQDTPNRPKKQSHKSNWMQLLILSQQKPFLWAILYVSIKLVW